MQDLLLSVTSFLVTVLRFLLQYGELWVLWGGIVAWESHNRKPLALDTKLGLYFGAFVGLSFWNWRKEMLRADAADEALAAEKEKRKEQLNPFRVFAEHRARPWIRRLYTGQLRTGRRRAMAGRLGAGVVTHDCGTGSIRALANAEGQVTRSTVEDEGVSATSA